MYLGYIRIAVVVTSLFLSTIALCVATTAQESEVINSVKVIISVKQYIPKSITDRISSSVQEVGNRALDGKTLEEAHSLEDSLQQVMKKIFSEVLNGFDVEDLSIKIASETEIKLYISATEPFVSEVNIEVLPPQGVSSFWNKTFSVGLKGVASEIADRISGVPVESESWTEPLIKNIVVSELDLEKRFPGFEVDTLIDIGEETSVKLIMKPIGEVIRHVSVKMRSRTMPSIAIERLKFDMAGRVDLLLGLPIVFVQENEGFIVGELNSYISALDFSGKLHLDFGIRLIIYKQQAVVNVVAESRLYSGFARLKVSIGEEFRNPDLEGHMGIFPVKNVELFTEFNFLPGPIDLQFNVGAGQRLGNFYIAGGRNVLDGYNRMWGIWNLSEDIILSWEKNVVADPAKDVEGAIMFRAHEFFSIELVTDFNKDIWVRFNANL